jgi:Carbohydrate-binding domain-containing protein Cthe_2159
LLIKSALKQATKINFDAYPKYQSFFKTDMNSSKLILLVSFLTFCSLACTTTTTDPSPTTPTTTNTADSQTPLEQIEASADYTYDANSANTIKLNGGTITVAGSGSVASGGTVTINAAGTYIVSGSLTNGQIKVQTDALEAVKIVLNGIDIANSSTSPIFIDKAKKVILFLAKGTSNKVTDADKYTAVAEGQNAAIYSQTYLAIAGEGNLAVTGNFADGIASKDGLVINGGTIVVKAKDEGIRGKDYLVVRNGNLDITTTTGDGMKSDFETDAKYGYVLIDKGNFKITAQGDGITAQTTLTVKAGTFNITTGGGSGKTVATGVSAKAFKGKGIVKLAATNATINSADDGINSNIDVIIEKGTYAISSADDGIHANASVTVLDGDITVSKSFEGVESKKITFEKGQFNIVSSNDAINATAGSDAQQDDGSFIYIKGGSFVLDAQGGDPLDSNGGLSMEGGTVVIHGPAGMEVPIDYNASFVVTKGTIIASGSNSRMLQAPSTSSKINSLKLLFTVANNANTLFNITDESGNSLVTFKPIKGFASIIYTSEKLIKDKKYNVYTGGTVTGNEVGGNYDGTYTGGTLRGNFTVSSSVTSVTL